MLDPGNEVFLCDTGLGRNKYGIVAANIADYFGPAAAVERECNTLCGANRCFNDQQIGARRLDRSKQPGYGSELVVIGLTTGG